MKNQNDEKTINPAAALATGVVIGAGAAIAGAVMLKDKKNQAKMKKAMNNVKNQFSDHIEQLQKTVHEKKDKGEEKITKGKEELKEVTNSTKNTLKDKEKNI